MSLYDLLDQIIINREFELSPDLFVSSDKEQLEDEDKKVFDILKKISSLAWDIYVYGGKYFCTEDGRKIFARVDLLEEDYKVISELEFERIPLILRALIADVLWVNKNDYKAAEIAADAYWELFIMWYKEGNRLGSIDMITRAVCISKQKNQPLIYESIYEWFKVFLESDDVYKDIMFTLRIMELFCEQKDFDVFVFLPILDSFIAGSKDDFLETEQTYKFKSKCLFRLKRKDEAKKNNIALAKYYLDYAEDIFIKDVQRALRVEKLYEEGIKLYRDNKKPEEAEKAQRRLVEIQKEIPKTMVPIKIELDISDVVENIKANMEDLSFEESVIRLTQMLSFEKQEDIKKRVLEENKKNPVMGLGDKSLYNNNGQKIMTLPSVDNNKLESDPNLMELYMFQNELQKQKMVGDIWIKNALNIIKERFVVEKSKVEFLVKDNPIIPDDRKRIFQSGIYMFINGDFYEALHVLVPQVENLFRSIARDTGGLTLTLDDKGLSMEKVLSSVFLIPELLECYDNNILFMFRGLLNEKAGANIRNEIAHGIMSEDASSSGACLYFGVAVMKLLSLTSASYYQILKNSKKLNTCVKPSKDALKVIRKNID